MSPPGRFLVLSLTTCMLLPACTSTYGQTFAEPTSLSRGDAFDCVANELGEMGYTIEDAERQAGFVRAQTPEPTAMRLDGQLVFAEMEVSITEAEGDRTLRVTATAVEDGQVDQLMEACS